MRIKKWAALTVGFAAVVGIGASYAEITERAAAISPGQNNLVARLLAARSPGERGAAAVSTKRPAFKEAAWRPLQPAKAALGERTPAVAKMAAVAPAALPATSIAPAVLAPSAAAPTAVAPLAVATPAAVGAVVAATGGTSLGAAALLPAIPLILAASDGGGSGGGGGGGGGSVPVAPAVPEPSTWMMMISGFAMLGFALRRRRRQLRHVEKGGTEGASFATQQC